MAVALVLLIVAVLVILVVFVMRRKQGSKPLENVEHKGGFSPLGNPVYTGKQISIIMLFGELELANCFITNV